MRNAYKILVSKQERKRPLGKAMHKNLKMRLKEIGCGVLNSDGSKWSLLTW
jgi:hypothetical protein